MTGRALLVAALLLAAAAAAILLWPRRAQGPEEAVRALVAGATAGAEAHDAARVLAAVAEDFRGPGGSSRQELQQLVLSQLLKFEEPLVVLNPSLAVAIQSPTTATFSGTFLFLRGRSQQSGSRYQVDATLERRDGAWKVVTARWREVPAITG